MILQVHTFKQACVAVYPSTVQHDIVWFWPNSDPQYMDIITKKKPPYMPELDDPSFTKSFGNRDISYGYDIKILSLLLLSLIKHHPLNLEQCHCNSKMKRSLDAPRPLYKLLN